MLNGSQAPCKKLGNFYKQFWKKITDKQMNRQKNQESFIELFLSKQILRWIGYIYKIDYFRCIVTHFLDLYLHTSVIFFTKKWQKCFSFFSRNYMLQRSSKYSNTVPRRIKSCTKTQSKQYIKLKFHKFSIYDWFFCEIRWFLQLWLIVRVCR